MYYYNILRSNTALTFITLSPILTTRSNGSQFAHVINFLGHHIDFYFTEARA